MFTLTAVYNHKRHTIMKKLILSLFLLAISFTGNADLYIDVVNQTCSLPMTQLADAEVRAYPCDAMYQPGARGMARGEINVTWDFIDGQYTNTGGSVSFAPSQFQGMLNTNTVDFPWQDFTYSFNGCRAVFIDKNGATATSPVTHNWVITVVDNLGPDPVTGVFTVKAKAVCKWGTYP